MESNAEKKWFAVYTKSRCEKKVSELLTKRKIDNYCPVNKVVKKWADRKKTVLEPLFNSYVFVNVSEKDFLPVIQTTGVLNFVYWLGKPAEIRHSEIDAIKNFLHNHQDVTLERVPVKLNDEVRIVYGPLMRMEGSVVEVMNKTVKVYLPHLGYAMVAEVKTGNVEVISQQPQNHL